MKRWIWVICLVAIAGGGIFMGFRPQPVLVETARVSSAPLRVTVDEEGKTRLRTRYIVSAPITGFTRRLNWKAGDFVKAGQVIAQLEPARPATLDARAREQAEANVRVAQASLAVAEARLATAEAQLPAARADLNYWKKQQEREETLRRSGDLAVSRVEKTLAERQRAEATATAAERSVATARAEIVTARAEVASAQTVLRRTSSSPAGELVAVTAPASGRVIRLIRESEGVVNSGDGLIEIGDANAIEVASEVLSADAVKVAPGMKVLLTRWGGDGTLEARVRVVEPGGFTKVSALGVEEQRVRVIADITSPENQWKRLGDGYRVEAAFVLWEGENVLQVPANALFRDKDGWAVFVEGAGVARRKPVQVGHRSGITAEIAGGLVDGDIVITHPDETVADGKPVKADKGNK